MDKAGAGMFALQLIVQYAKSVELPVKEGLNWAVNFRISDVMMQNFKDALKEPEDE